MAPDYLEGIDEELRAYVRMAAEGSDDFWSEGLEATLDAHWEANPTEAVRRTLEEWQANVRERIEDLFGPQSLVRVPNGERRRVTAQLRRLRLRADPALVDHLLDAALVGAVGHAQAAVLVVQGIITPYQKTAEGQLVRAVAEPWLRVLRTLGARWERAYQIPADDWEHIVAAAFDHAGYDEVTLTPRSGDHGRDVIAVRHGVGAVRIINSVKAYAPDRRVTHDDVRALAGVLLGDPQASKGIVATTAEFAPKIASDPYLAPLMPYRLELMNGARLRAWLSELLATTPVPTLPPATPTRDTC